MGYWKSLIFNVGRTGENIAENISYRYLRKKDGNLVYINSKGYKNVAIHVSKQTIMQLIEQQANSLLPKYSQYLERRKRKSVLKQQSENYKVLIDKGEKIDQELGTIDVTGHKIIAKDKYGNKQPKALMLYYDTGREIEVTDIEYQDGQNIETSYKTSTICFIDLIASVSMQSCKNLILTTVQGRDFTRKELISGGDICFSVSGKIVGNDMEIYPENDVKKFIQIMQYGGIIKVNHFLFKQFNIEQVIIKDYNMGESDCRNTQPYSFTCVAVEPDEDVAITADTIGVLNNEISTSPTSFWYKLILNNKLTSITNTMTDNVIQGTAIGLDSLLPNI